jgi:hypothetical protein
MTDDVVDDAPDADGALLDAAANIIEGRAKSDAITSAELSDRLGLDDGEASPKARDLVRTLITERAIPVRSGSVGYWVCQSEAEAEEYLDTLRGRIAGIETRMDCFEVAWQSHKRALADGGTTTTTDDSDDGDEPEVPEGVREQLEDDPVLTVEDWLAAHGDGAEVGEDA